MNERRLTIFLAIAGEDKLNRLALSAPNYNCEPGGIAIIQGTDKAIAP